MTQEQFETLVARLEAEARRRPAAYRSRVLLLALLGNAYLFLVLLVVAALFVALLVSVVYLKAAALKLAAVVGTFLWMMVQALWVRLEPPEGVEIRRADAPALFAMIDELRQRLRAPRFHRVLITDDFNAGVAQQPRLGLFGWPRNYLLIGLPLMKTLGVEPFKAVLAHELGHLARGHGRTSNWIYRQRLRWSRLMGVLEAQRSRGTVLFQPFLRRFAPYFNAYSFPLARANEYEADAASVRLTSPRAAAEALTTTSVVASYLYERFWPTLHRQADEQPVPSFAPYRGMAARVAGELDTDSARAWVERAMAEATTCEDTHPALADRLRAIGEGPRVALPEPGKTADRLLGRALPALTERLDRRWQDTIRPAWEERHRQVQEARRQLAALDARHAAGETLSVEDAYDRARLTESVAGRPDEALAQLRALHERAPDDATVSFALGASLLARDDDAGFALVERAIQLDDDLLLHGAELLRDHHWRRGRKEEAHAWHARLCERAALEKAAEAERNQVRLSDRFDRHGLTEQELEALRAQLRAVPGLRKGYLVRKRVAHFPQRPCFVFGFTVSRWYQLHTRKRAAAVLQAIQASVRFPGETLILNVEGDHDRFGRKLRLTRGARIL